MSGSFDCPACKSPRTGVIDSRPATQFQGVKRRRSCPECLHRFTTYEVHGKNALFAARERERRIFALAQQIKDLTLRKISI